MRVCFINSNNLYALSIFGTHLTCILHTYYSIFSDEAPTGFVALHLTRVMLVVLLG